jgi:hypothetical protein
MLQGSEAAILLLTQHGSTILASMTTFFVLSFVQKLMTNDNRRSKKGDGVSKA